MEKEVEQQIISELEAVDVLLMPHHGSKTSSTVSFVKTTQPKVVIAQTGRQNYYGFPKAEVVKRYQKVGGQIWDTAEGAVSILFSDTGYATEQFSNSHTSKRKDIEAWLSTFHQ